MDEVSRLTDICHKLINSNEELKRLKFFPYIKISETFGILPYLINDIESTRYVLSTIPSYSKQYNIDGVIVTAILPAE